MRTMPPPMMRRGNRRASRQNHASHENRECLDDLVHVTPAAFRFRFPAGALLPLTESQEALFLKSDRIISFSRFYILLLGTRANTTIQFTFNKANYHNMAWLLRPTKLMYNTALNALLDL